MKLEKDKVKVILGDEMMEENMQSTEFINKQQKKKNKFFYGFITILVICVLMFFIKLPYFVSMPGNAIDSETVIQVEHKDEGEKGAFLFTTVSMARANPFLYVLSFFNDYYELEPIEDVLAPGMSEEEYFNHTLLMMDASQQSAKLQAYEAAGKTVNYKNQKLIVYQVIEGMPADGILEAGDQILQVNGESVTQSQELIDRVGKMKSGEMVHLTIERAGEKKEVDIEIQPFADDKTRVGVGIQLITTGDIEVSPSVQFHTENIGGPSAGLMFTLEMIAQLTDGDQTKGHLIAGTGTMEADGTVGAIGGIDKKVVAAHKVGAEIFFAPNENGIKNSNYEVALKAAKDIGTDMEIVPVDSLQDALDYLDQLEEKS